MFYVFEGQRGINQANKIKVLLIVPHQDDEINIAGDLLDRNIISPFVVFTTNGDYKYQGATRIKEAVGLLRSFGLQAILSTPSEKLRDLSKEVDLVLVTINDQKKHRSYIDKYKEIKR